MNTIVVIKTINTGTTAFRSSKPMYVEKEVYNTRLELNFTAKNEFLCVQQNQLQIGMKTQLLCAFNAILQLLS